MQSSAFSRTQKAQIRNELQAELGRRDFLHFGQLISGGAFQAPAHIRIMIDALERVTRGEIKRLMINMPPRHGKSWTVSKFWPLWLLTGDPSREIILGSYAATLAYDFSRWIRDKASSPEYTQYYSLPLNESSRAVDRWETKAGGALVAAGVGGPVTGRGAHFAIIDDAVKNWEEAMSPRIQERNLNWYDSTLETRLHPQGAVIVTATRWAKGDLPGPLIEREGTVEDGGDWTVIRMPAINDRGEALWPDRYGIEELSKRRAKMIPMIWSALFQQAPISAGSLFGDMQYGDWPKWDQRRPRDIRAWCDPAYGGKDTTALVVMTREGDDVHLKGWVWRKSIIDLYATIAVILQDHSCGTLCMDSTGDKGLAAEAMAKHWPATIGKPESMNKHAKIVSYVGGNWGRLKFAPDSMPEFLEQVLSYAEGAQPDDGPDAVACILREVLPGGSAEGLIGRFSIYG